MTVKDPPEAPWVGVGMTGPERVPRWERGTGGVLLVTAAIYSVYTELSLVVFR
jgi:hypothetical protein